MVSRPLIISCLAAASSIHGGVAADPPRRPLRGPSGVDAAAPTGRGGIPYAAAARRRARFLQGNATGTDAASIFENAPQDNATDANAADISESVPQENSTGANVANISENVLQENATGANDANIFENVAITEDDGAALEEDAITTEEDATVEEETPTAVVEDVNDANTVEVPPECLELLLDSANEFGKLKKENFFLFTDGMSNGWYTLNNMTSYGDLPAGNKFAYVTLTCRCYALGEKEGCCQGDHAKIDLTGVDDPETMTREMQLYVNDICSTTSGSIGDNKLPATGRPTTARPTTSVAPIRSPTADPTASAPPTATALEVVVEIPVVCLNLLAASANDNGVLKKENYFVFTDGMSNGYYTANNITEYSDLPPENKFAYVTLTCQCHAMGGRGNCCQGPRAKLDVAGIEEPETMSAQLQNFVNDICSVTAHVIGDNKLDPSGELPTTARPTTSVPPTVSPAPTRSSAPTASPAPTASSAPSSSPPTARPTPSPTPSPTTGPTTGPTRPPSVSPSTEPTPGPTKVPTWLPSVSPSRGPTASPTASAKPSAAPFDGTPDRLKVPSDGEGDDDEALGMGAWVGIGFAITLLLCLCCSLCLYLARRKREDKEVDDEARVVGGMDRKVHGVRDECPDTSPDTGNSALTDGGAVDSAVPGTVAYSTGSNLLLPDMRGDGDDFIGDLTDPGAVEEGVAVQSPGVVTHDSDANASTLAASNASRNTQAIGNGPAGQSDLNQAAESGNWEAVANAAARQNEFTLSSAVQEID